jgi:type IX secretion system PorP/SprF family membrane protein
MRFAKSDYKVTFGSRLHKMGRNLQRMLDNPIALRNQRDPYYHVPGMQAMDVNFSSIGTMLATRVQATGRAQWLGSDNQQIMSQLSIDGYSYAIRGGLGFQMSHNYYGLGEIQNYNAALTYSPKFSVSRGVTVEPSVRFKMGSKMLDSKNLLPGTKVEYDRSTVQEFLVNGSAPIGKQLWYKDLGLGLMVNTKWFYAGIQGDDLFNHYDNIYSNALEDQRRVGSHFVATLGTDYESIKKTITVSPYIVYQQRETLKEAWLGTTVKLKWLTVGGAISSNLEPAASIGLKFQQFAITYNADYTQSALLNQRSLSHQMTIRFVSKPSRIGQRLLN